MRFNHLGVACRNLDSEQRAWSDLGYAVEGTDFVDPNQGIRGRFLTGPGPRLELLVETEGSSVIQPWLRQGVKIYHQAFETEEFSAAIATLEGSGARVVSPPTPAVAFGGRKVCFLMLRNLALVELIEAASA